MKLAPLLASYLYTHKQLELPGLGVFMLDPGALSVPETKAGKTIQLEGVSFENKPSIRESPELVQYISSQTGKIRALASADLESHLGLAQQFLNIGKPFLFEGIGSLVKTRSGEFVFTSGQLLPEAIGEYTTREGASTPTEESKMDYRNLFNQGKTPPAWRRPLAFFLLLAGMALAIWGGYRVYQRSASNKTEVAAAENVAPAESIPASDSSTVKKDSVKVQPPALVAGQMKFVLETAQAKRAFERFQKLKSYQWAVQMETNDSLLYKLYVVMPALAADTTRILDSLTRMNGKRVYIE